MAPGRADHIVARDPDGDVLQALTTALPSPELAEVPLKAELGPSVAVDLCGDRVSRAVRYTRARVIVSL
jgi:hypothetical protein